MSRLRSDLADLFKGVADVFEGIANVCECFHNVLEGIADALIDLADLLVVIADLFYEVLDVLGDVANVFEGTADVLKDITNLFEEVADLFHCVANLPIAPIHALERSRSPAYPPPMPDFDNFDPDDNFAASFSSSEDLDEDAALEAVAWQFLLLVNPGDEDAAALQFADVRDALGSGAEPIDAVRDAIDWKSGFFLAEDDAQGVVEALDELAARVGVRIDWDLDDEDDDALADADAGSLLSRAAVQLRERGYSLWTWETGSEHLAGWIAARADDEAVPVVANALGFHVRSAI